MQKFQEPLCHTVRSAHSFSTYVKLRSLPFIHIHISKKTILEREFLPMFDASIINTSIWYEPHLFRVSLYAPVLARLAARRNFQSSTRLDYHCPGMSRRLPVWARRASGSTTNRPRRYSRPVTRYSTTKQRN